MEEKVKARIVIDDKIRHGKPVIERTRITVDEILGALIGGMNYEEIEREYGIERGDILAVIEYTASFVRGEALSKYRSEVIEKFINAEMIINAIISQHYFKKVLKPFLLEVLYDEYFSFGLKRRIIEKIIPDIDTKKIHDLNRLNTIRNYFAHSNQEFFEGSEKPKPGIKGIIPDPRDIEKGIDFEKLYKEFIEKESEVTKYLAKIFTDIGGVLEKE